MQQVGFVILSHNQPQQLLRLVHCLERIYDKPPIVVHHDFSQSQIRLEDFPSDIKFVSPHVKTRWGRFSVVTAALRALELLYAIAEPKWFFLLSGADYPIMPARTVLDRLAANEVDALLDYRAVPDIGTASKLSLPDNPSLRCFASPSNSAKAWHRYVGLNIWFPIIRTGPRVGRYTLYLSRRAWISPFGPTFKCFYGDHWFAGNSKVASILLNPTDKHLRLRRHLRLRDSPEECYYATVLANTDGLRISTSTGRFAMWTDGDAHPKLLGSSDVKAITQSKAYFARKFAPDSGVLDEIDRLLSRV
jgi:hypothetical protein